MTRTREENVADLAHEATAAARRKPVYVLVAGTPSHADDGGIPGIYRADMEPETPPEAQAEGAIDLFHEENGIEVVEAFSVVAVNADGVPLPRAEGEFKDVAYGEYAGRVDGDAPEAVVAAWQNMMPKAPQP